MIFDYDVQPPSVFLPQIRDVRTCPGNDLADAIARLREIYIHPQVRGSTRRRPQTPTESSRLAPAKRPLAGPISNLKLSDQEIAWLSADSFERSFTIQWLTRFISISSELTLESEDEVVWGVDILEQAASLLAICAGAAASGNVERVFTFPFTAPGSHPSKDDLVAPLLPHERANDSSGRVPTAIVDEIRVVLRDAPLESADFSSVGAQTWGGSCVLAEMIAEHPENFGIFEEIPSGTVADRIRPPFRVLELGAGTGLVSLVLGKVLERVKPLGPLSQAHHEIEPSIWFSQAHEWDVVVATDFHPSVLVNLNGNVERNFPHETVDAFFNPPLPTNLDCPRSGPHVVVLPLDWSLIHDVSNQDNRVLPSLPASESLATSPQFAPAVPATNVAGLSSLFDVPFDLIIGADIIYEPLHARWLRSCIERFLRRPDDLSRTLSSVALSPPASDSKASVSEMQLDPALFHLVIPLRRTHSLESSTMEEVFAPASEIIAAREITNRMAAQSVDGTSASQKDLSSSFSAPVLAVLSQEDIVCDAYLDTGEGEEVTYRYYKIGWI